MYCGQRISQAQNGTDRGVCLLVAGHQGCHGSGMCPRCGVKLTKNNASSYQWARKSGYCQKCKNETSRQHANRVPMNTQSLGKYHVFPCGCSGILPPSVRQSNMLAIGGGGSSFHCRVSVIITASQRGARIGKFTPIPLDTPHIHVRELMRQPNCERCGEPLVWELGKRTTPHLHHNHKTGEIYGFTHPVCNPQALEREIDKLRAIILARRRRNENGRLPK